MFRSFHPATGRWKSLSATVMLGVKYNIILGEIYMSISGIWAIEVAGIYGWENRGIMIFNEENKNVIEGGRNHYSVGSYTRSKKKIRIKLKVHFHGKAETMFGAKEKEVSMVIEGTRKGDKITGAVKNPKNSKHSIPVRLTRRADLP